MFGDGTEERALDAMQFMLAPWDLDGNNPDPTRRPVVVSQASWGLSSFNCSERPASGRPSRPGLQPASSPRSRRGRRDSGNRIPSAYPETFETGATYPDGTRMESSSAGPSCFDGGQLPHVMAGGDWIRSANNESDAASASCPAAAWPNRLLPGSGHPRKPTPS